MQVTIFVEKSLLLQWMQNNSELGLRGRGKGEQDSQESVGACIV
jgi:hypothetical protein